MKLLGTALLGLAALALAGCNTVYGVDHPYTNARLGVQYGAPLTMSKLDRDNHKKEWDDELCRQSEGRLATYLDR
ncbi:MAG TPA: hypothetical protein VMI15_05715 [Burkholderiales bacterium]|nr:hypothetical protein [Burkholderiales bacterium]